MLSSSADERFAIEHYFERGFRYETIVHFPGRIQWDSYQRKDFEEKDKTVRATNKK